MTEGRLLDRERLPFEEWAVTPDSETIAPNRALREQKGDEFRRDITNAYDLDELGAVVLTHVDADGLTSGALIREMTDGFVPIQEVTYDGHYQLEDGLEDILETGIEGVEIVISDINPDDSTEVDLIRRIADRGNEFTWYDHHQWGPEVKHTYEPLVDLYIDENECTASLIREMNHEYDFDTHIEDLIEVTKDRDLWINDDPRSEDLSTFAFMSGPDEYIETVRSHGANLPDDILDMVQEKQELDSKIEEYAIEKAEFRNIAGYKVGITYISGGVSSNIGNTLVEELDADIALVMRASGTTSIYSHSDGETFARCHEVAELMGGGGHPTASGFPLNFNSFRKLAQYWASEGKEERFEIFAVIHDVVVNDE